jgi:hypothetical protein
MVVGAGVYAELYPFFKTTVLAWSDLGKVGLPETLGVAPFWLILGFWGGALSLFAWFERMRL